MTVTVAVIAAGAMGAGVGGRLTERGARVLTSLAGRSEASRHRAQAAGMRDAADAEIAGADILLSIVPPGEALNLARRLAPALSAATRKPVFVDCNAISPATAESVAAAIAPTGASFVDGGIIGGPPKAGSDGPTFYLSGPAAGALHVLSSHDLRIRVLDGPVGAASALKMSYAGITKGLTALGAAMMLGAARGGSAEALKQELAESQPALLAWLSRAVPGMYGKAYRWVAEMEEIAAFLGRDDEANGMFRAAAAFYERIAADAAGSRTEIAAMDSFIAPPATRAAAD